MKLAALLFGCFGCILSFNSVHSVRANTANLYKIENTVVLVKVKKKSYPSNYKEDPFTTIGHGVIVRSDGYILINNSLLDESVDVIIIFQDEMACSGKVVGRDLKTDLALIKIDSNSSYKQPQSKLQEQKSLLSTQPAPSINLPAVSYGQALTGSNVLIMSCPYNMPFSLSHAIISSDKRSATKIAEIKSFYGNVVDVLDTPLLQYESPVPSNGGILFDEDGKFVGITTPLVTKLGCYGLNFAVPAHIASAVVADLIAHGKVLRGYAGVMMQSIDEKLFAANKMNKIPTKEYAPLFGAIVVELEKNGPAAKAGLQVQDIVVSIDGKLVTNHEDARARIKAHKPGEVITLEVWRKCVQIQGDKPVATKDANKDASKDVAKDASKDAPKNTSQPASKDTSKDAPKDIAKETKEEYKLITLKLSLQTLEVKSANIDVNRSKHMLMKLVTLTQNDKVSQAKSAVDSKVQNGLIIADIMDPALALDLRIHDVIIQAQHQNVYKLDDFDKIIAKALSNNERYIVLLVARGAAIFSCALEIANIRIENFDRKAQVAIKTDASETKNSLKSKKEGK